MRVGLFVRNTNSIRNENIQKQMPVQNKKNVSSKRFLAIIPARFASTRFPGKPLVEIGGKTMIQRVYEQVSKAVENVYVATDDIRIHDACVAFGANVIMTSELHRSGTDRCYEAYTKLGEKFDVIINVQGDEPFIQPEQIETLKACFEHDNTQIATLAKRISKTEGTEFLVDPNHPKLIVNKNDEAMRDFNIAIKSDPALPEAYNNRGILFQNTGNIEAALKDFSKAIELKSEYTNAYINRANILRDEKKYKEAQIDYNKSIELDPTIAIAYYNRAINEFYSGEKDKACMDFKHAAELGLQVAADAYRKASCN